MSHGVTVSDSSVPEEMKELYGALLKAKSVAAGVAPLQRAHREFLRQTVLFAGDREV